MTTTPFDGKPTPVRFSTRTQTEKKVALEAIFGVTLLSGRARSGKAGGEKTKARHGSEFFRKIGKKGGVAKGKRSHSRS